MKTSNKLIIVTIIITIAAPILYGFLLVSAAKNNLPKGLEFEKMVLSDTVNISTGQFHSVDISSFSIGIDHFKYLRKTDLDKSGSDIPNTRGKIAIQNGDSSFIRIYGANTMKRMICDNDSGRLAIKQLIILPYFQLSENSYYKMYLKMNAPDIEIIAPNLNSIQTHYRCDVKFDNYTTDSLTLAINDGSVIGNLNVDYVNVRGINSYFLLNSSTAQKATFNIINNSTLIWGSVADTMHVSGFRNGVIKIQKHSGHVNFLDALSIKEMAVFVPDSTGRMIDVAKLLNDKMEEQKQRAE